DVYAVRVPAGKRLVVALHGPGVKGLALALWRPGTRHVNGAPQAVASQRLSQSLHAGPNQNLVYRATSGGWYDVEVKVVAPGAGAAAGSCSGSGRRCARTTSAGSRCPGRRLLRASGSSSRRCGTSVARSRASTPCVFGARTTGTT